MTCLACITSVFIAGSIGVQNVDSIEEYRTNDYGLMIGNLDLVVEFENNMFVKASHLSGLNTVELDWGKNSIEIGGKIYLFKKDR
jgi:hypothetical protein